MKSFSAIKALTRGEDNMLSDSCTDLFLFEESPRGLKTACIQLLRRDGLDKLLDNVESVETGDGERRRSLVFKTKNLSHTQRQQIQAIMKEVAESNDIAFKICVDSSITYEHASLRRQYSSETMDQIPPNKMSLKKTLSGMSITLSATPSATFKVSAVEKVDLHIRNLKTKQSMIVGIPSHFESAKHSYDFENNVLEAFSQTKTCIVGFGFMSANNQPKFIRREFGALTATSKNLTVYFANELRQFDAWVSKCITENINKNINFEDQSFAQELFCNNTRSDEVLEIEQKYETERFKIREQEEIKRLRIRLENERIRLSFPDSKSQGRTGPCESQFLL